MRELPQSRELIDIEENQPEEDRFDICDVNYDLVQHISTETKTRINIVGGINGAFCRCKGNSVAS